MNEWMIQKKKKKASGRLQYSGFVLEIRTNPEWNDANIITSCENCTVNRKWGNTNTPPPPSPNDVLQQLKPFYLPTSRPRPIYASVGLLNKKIPVWMSRRTSEAITRGDVLSLWGPTLAFIRSPLAKKHYASRPPPPSPGADLSLTSVHTTSPSHRGFQPQL